MKMRLKQAFFNSSYPCRGAGPQHRDFRKESLQTKQAGERTKLFKFLSRSRFFICLSFRNAVYS
ncbi:hypothetical protein CD127_01080 [Staphylococcus petrasii]|nr:hypothetical protein CD127_01080 [Staphylococcus petrasii]TGA81298.1 hypothetical protein E2554_07210 [Staphylococcus petrasii]